MTTTKLLYELQELDGESGGLTQRLSVVDNSLGNRTSINSMENSVDQKAGHVQKLEGIRLDSEMAVDSGRAKIEEVEGKLYGGSVKNPRELQDLDRELKGLKETLQSLEDKVLESLVILEQAQEEHTTESGQLEIAKSAWAQEQEHLVHEKEGLLLRLGRLDTKRKKAAQQLEPKELQLYERLRVAKGGQAVALVERGLCRACSMALATHQLQRARSGRESVLCGTCGRILYVE